MHAGSAPVIRLEGPLALGHGILLVVSCITIRSLALRNLGRSTSQSEVVLLLAGAAPRHIVLGRSRIADFRATV